MRQILVRGMAVGAAMAVGLWALGTVAAAAGPWQLPKQPMPQGARRGVITQKTALRSGASEAAPVVRALPKGLSVAVYGVRDGFCGIQLRNGKQGYVEAGAVRPAEPLKGNCF